LVWAVGRYSLMNNARSFEIVPHPVFILSTSICPQTFDTPVMYWTREMETRDGQPRNHATTQTRRHADTQTHRHADTQKHCYVITWSRRYATAQFR
jgi:hypothetical protein